MDAWQNSKELQSNLFEKCFHEYPRVPDSKWIVEQCHVWGSTQFNQGIQHHWWCLVARLDQRIKK